MRRLLAARLPDWCLSPLIGLPVLWVVGVLLSRLDYFQLEQSWSLRAWLLIALAPVAFVVGGALGRQIADGLALRPGTASAPVSTRRLRIVLGACVVIGFLELARQFAGAGGVPLLSNDVDAVRVMQPGGPLVVLTDLLTVATIIAMVSPRRLLAREAAFELSVIVVSTGGFLLAGGRGPAVTGLIAGLLGRWLLRRRPPIVGVLIAAIALLAAFTLSFYLRTSQHKGDPFESELYLAVLPHANVLTKAYLPTHIGLTFNFDVLARLATAFPSGEPWGHGAYSVAGFDAIVPGTRSLGAVALRYTSPFTTSTAVGPYWADFGFLGAAVGMVAFGAFSMFVFRVGTRLATPVAAGMAGYVAYVALFGVYANLYTDHPDWVIVLLGLAGCGVVLATDPRAIVARAPRVVVGAGRALVAASLPAMRRYGPVLVVVVVASVAMTLVHAPTRAVVMDAAASQLSVRSARLQLPTAFTRTDAGTMASLSTGPDTRAGTSAVYAVVPDRVRRTATVARAVPTTDPHPRPAVLGSLRLIDAAQGATFTVLPDREGLTVLQSVVTRTSGAPRSVSVTLRSYRLPGGVASPPRDVDVQGVPRGAVVTPEVLQGAGRPTQLLLVAQGAADGRARFWRVDDPLARPHITTSGSLVRNVADFASSKWAITGARFPKHADRLAGVLFKGSSGHAELHQLDASKAYASFAGHAQLPPARLPSNTELLAGTLDGVDGYFVVAPTTGSVNFYPA